MEIKFKKQDFSGDKILKMPKIGKTSGQVAAEFVQKKQAETERRIKSRFSR